METRTLIHGNRELGTLTQTGKKYYNEVLLGLPRSQVGSCHEGIQPNIIRTSTFSRIHILTLKFQTF